MNFYQKLSQPAVRAEMAEEWGSLPHSGKSC